MKILASSLADTAHRFLHAGYISAYPRSMDPGYLPSDPPKLKLDMVEALRLEGESLAALPPGGDTAPAATALTQLVHWPSLLMAALGAAAMLVLYCMLGEQMRARVLRRLPALSIATVVAALGANAACGGSDLPPLPTHAPWEGVTLQAYANPEQATLALMHGIIADGITNVGQPIQILPNIQNEVGIASKTLTEGQAYALKTYGIDGWGKPFRLTAGATYEVRSAGPDGAFDTADDLSIDVAQCDDSSWESGRHAFFIRKDGEDHSVLFHRWTGEFFQYYDEAGAAATTGSKLFDRWAWAELSTDQQQRVASVYAEVASGLDHEPLVLMVF